MHKVETFRLLRRLCGIYKYALETSNPLQLYSIQMQCAQSQKLRNWPFRVKCSQKLQRLKNIVDDTEQPFFLCTEGQNFSKYVCEQLGHTVQDTRVIAKKHHYLCTNVPHGEHKNNI